MKSQKIAAIALAAAMTGALGMSACGTNSGPAEPAPSSSAPDSPSDSGSLLLLNDSLRAKLGDEYSDSWIEGNKLHVAVTTKAAAAIVTAAGAIPKLVTINAAQLEAALQAVSAWQARLPADQGAAIQRIIPDGNTATITIYVAADQLDAVSRAAAADKPAGAVPLVIKESAGLATPL
ncbi:hypothetical protein AAGW05_07965 [Arthrobacter sp. LAPM80]|uniref:hypothetical protein n=1 Tax=Arthrobacter sp. LAPM80 TaxID=3141788 RepID=UPI00398B14AE